MCYAIAFYFTEGTLVATPTGTVSIESIQQGDSVYAYNEQTKSVETRSVTATSKRWYEGQIIHIVVGADTIQATAEHPFYVQGSWVAAEHLKVGDRLTLLGGRTDNVRATWSCDTALFVYNFTVEEQHTYYVSSSGVLVHNQCDAGASELPALLPDGSFYSVAFEMNLELTSYPGVTRYMHFKEANTALDAAMQTNPLLGELGISVPRKVSGAIDGRSPTNWVWHHNVNQGVMQLVPKSQHPNIPGGIFWEIMHPGGVGGYSI